MNGSEAKSPRISEALDPPRQSLPGYKQHLEEGQGLEVSCGTCKWKREHRAVHPLSGKPILQFVCVRYPPTVHPLPEITEQHAASLALPDPAIQEKPRVEFKPTSMFPWVLQTWVCGEWTHGVA